MLGKRVRIRLAIMFSTARVVSALSRFQVFVGGELKQHRLQASVVHLPLLRQVRLFYEHGVNGFLPVHRADDRDRQG